MEMQIAFLFYRQLLFPKNNLSEFRGHEAIARARVHIFKEIKFSETWQRKHIRFKVHALPQILTRSPDCVWGFKNSPGLLIAEFLGDHFSQLEPKAVGHFLGQVVVRTPAEQHDVGHGGNARARLDTCAQTKPGKSAGKKEIN